MSLNLPETMSYVSYCMLMTVLMRETIKGLKNMFSKWKEAFESMVLKVNLGITKVMVSGSITKDDMSKGKVDPCGVCSLSVKANSVLCVQCCRWIHGRCTGVKMVTPIIPRNFAYRKCEGILEKQWNRKKSYVMKWKQ